MKKFVLFLSVLTALLTLSAAAEATVVPETQARAWVNQTGQRLIRTLASDNLETKYAALDQMFEENVDIPYMARFVLGKYAKELTDEQKETYLQLFRRYTVSLYKTYPLDFDTEGLDFSILSVQDVGKYTKVTCRVMLPKAYTTENIKSITLEFQLTQNEVIQITDLKIGESSLLLTYRNRFMKMIKDVDDDMEWFLEDLSDQVFANEKANELRLEEQGTQE